MKKSLLTLLAINFVLMNTSAQHLPIRSFQLLPEEGEEIHSVDISNNGKFIATGSRKPILWDAETAEKIRVFQGHEEYDIDPVFPINIVSLSLSPNKKMVVTADSYRYIIVSDINTGVPIVKMRSENLYPNGKGFSGIEFLPDQKRVLSANSNGELELWDTDTGELIRKYTNRGSLNTMILLKDGKRVLLDYGGVVLLNLDSDEITHVFSGSSPSISSDEKVIQTIGTNKTQDGGAIIQYNLESYEKIQEFPLDPNQFESKVDISPDAKNYLIGNSIRKNGTTSVFSRMLFDAVTPGPIRTYQVDENADPNSPFSTDSIIKFFPDGKKFLTVNGNAVHIWDISDVATNIEHAHLHEN